MFGPKLTRVRFLRGIAYADGSAFNTGDVAELPEDQARAVVTAGTAEATSDMVGRATTPVAMRTCPLCGADNSEYALQCGTCLRRLA